MTPNTTELLIIFAIIVVLGVIVAAIGRIILAQRRNKQP